MKKKQKCTHTNTQKKKKFEKKKNKTRLKRAEEEVYKKLDVLVSDISGFSGADLESMVNLASIETVKADKSKIPFELLIEAKETIAMGRARSNLSLDNKTKQLTAFHESGHAIVSMFTKGSKPVYKATILPRGDALGFVASQQTDEFMATKQSLLAQMDTCMGGRAAEELFCNEIKDILKKQQNESNANKNGKYQSNNLNNLNGNNNNDENSSVDSVTTGASSDFSQATSIATAMVCVNLYMSAFCLFLMQ